MIGKDCMNLLCRSVSIRVSVCGSPIRHEWNGVLHIACILHEINASFKAHNTGLQGECGGLKGITGRHRPRWPSKRKLAVGLGLRAQWVRFATPAGERGTPWPAGVPTSSQRKRKLSDIFASLAWPLKADGSEILRQASGCCARWLT